MSSNLPTGTKNFRKRFSYEDLFRWKKGPFEIRHIDTFHKIHYDEARKGVPREQCYLFTVGALPYVLGYTYYHVQKMLHGMVKPTLPTEYFDGKKRWFSTAYILTLQHHRYQSYKYPSRRILTPLCIRRLQYICGEIDHAPPITETQMALKNAREKGNKFERDIANQVKDLYPNARRGMQFQNRFAGVTVPDVEGTPYWIECKHQIKPNIYAALEQAIRESAFAQDTRIPIAITKANRSEPLVTLKWADFYGMLLALEQSKSKARALDDFREEKENGVDVSD